MLKLKDQMATRLDQKDIFHYYYKFLNPRLDFEFYFTLF